MKTFFFSMYNLVLALWVGGIAAMTFVIIPLVFKSYPRDTASQIVNRLFPVYFPYILALSAFALVFLFLASRDRSQMLFHVSFILIVVTIFINSYVTFKLYPDAIRARQEVTSFEHEAADSPARKEFTRIHTVSAVLNLLVLGNGIALLLMSPFMKR